MTDAGPGHELPVYRLCMLRAMFLLIGLGQGSQIWPAAGPLFDSVGTSIARVPSMFIRLCGLLPYVFLMGCLPEARFAPTNPRPHALTSRPPASIEIFSSGPPARPHTDVGLLFLEGAGAVPGDGLGGNAAEWLALLREQASTQGCDAIVLQDFRTATCIVYNDASM
jgi:hypothetical protein